MTQSVNLSFAHLHVHTTYSVRDGAIKLKDLAKKCKENNMPACAMTDHGNAYGAVDFYMTMEKEGLKAILGYESYTSVSEKVEQALKSVGAEDRDCKNHHLVLLAKNNKGYANLLKLVSYENVEGFTKGGKFAKGNLDLDYVKQNNLGEGIICLTACLGGTTSKLINFGLYNDAKEYALLLKDTFEEVYIEVQDNTTKDQEMVNLQLVNLAKDLNMPLVLTKDAHYLNQEDWEAHDALLALQINKPIDDPNRWRFPGGPEYYLATPDEMDDFMTNRGHYIPAEAYTNTIKIADSCNVVLFDKEDENGNLIKGYYGGNLFPDFPDIPNGFNQETYLRKLSMDGLVEFIRTRPSNYSMDVQEYIDRVQYELDVICDTGYAGYFLILWDLMKYCIDYRDQERPHGIGLGPGRG